MGRVIFIGSIIIYLAFCSCEKETELDIPVPTSNLVVNSILTVGKPNKVYVGKSNYALDSSSMYIKNAVVVVRNNCSSVDDTLLYTEKGIYCSDRQICESNTTYTITIKAPDFEPVTASTQVPSTVKFSDFNFNNNSGIGPDGFKNKTLEIEFFDNVDIENYYMLLLTWSSLDSIPMQGYIGNNEWFSYSPVIIAEGDENQVAFSDFLFNGEKVTIPMNFHCWDYDVYYNLDFLLKCYLVTLNVDYFRYHKSISLYQESLDNIWQAQSAPQIYSNIENAFGIVSAINVSDSIVITF